MNIKQNKTSVLLEIFYKKILSEEENQKIIDVLINEQLFFPYKGNGYILVDDSSTAKSILQEHVECHDFKDFYEEQTVSPGKKLGLIQSYPEEGYGTTVSTGKMNIPNIHIYLQKLIDNNVVIYDFKFNKPEE